MGELLLTKAYRLTTSIEVGKLTALVVDSSAYADGIRVPTGANDGPVAGVARESILPDNVQDYSGGTYNIVSGTAWPANSYPTSSKGLRVSTVIEGIIRCVAAGAITRGAEVNIADNQGRIKAVSEVAGTLVYFVGEALDAASAVNDVIRVRVKPGRRIV